MIDQVKIPQTGELWVSTRLDILSLPQRTTGPDSAPAGPASDLKDPGTPTHDTPVKAALVQKDTDGNDVSYYQVTPSVWGWICRAMRTAGQAAQDGKLVGSEYDAARARFEVIRSWVETRYSREEIRSGLEVIRPLPGKESAVLVPVEGARGGESQGAAAELPPVTYRPVETSSTPDRPKDATALLIDLRSRGFSVWSDASSLKVRPREQLTPRDVADIRRLQGEMMPLLCSLTDEQIDAIAERTAGESPFEEDHLGDDGGDSWLKASVLRKVGGKWVAETGRIAGAAARKKVEKEAEAEEELETEAGGG